MDVISSLVVSSPLAILFSLCMSGAEAESFSEEAGGPTDNRGEVKLWIF